MASSKRAAAGCGTIRKKVVQRGGKEYVYWEARYSNGFDPGTGKQIQKNILHTHPGSFDPRAVDIGILFKPVCHQIPLYLFFLKSAFCDFLLFFVPGF